MDNAELASLERGIRTLLAELGLDWVRANIEEGVAAGVRKEVLVRSDRHQNESLSLFDEEEFQYAEPSSVKSGQRMIGNLRLDPAERMELITQALRRIIVELPEIHEDAIKYLASADNHDTAVGDLRFLPDDDDGTQSPPSLQAVTAPSARAARLAARAFLAELDHEVAQP